MSKRLFKTRSFGRWAKHLISDCQLCIAAGEIQCGLFEADLGGGLCKKRIALLGRGKRGGARALVAKRHREAIIFLIGREKSEAGSDFSESVVLAAKELAASLATKSLRQLDAAIDAGTLTEICHEAKGP